jgi:hypothetical protein
MNKSSYSREVTAREEAIRKDHDAAVTCQAVEQYLLNDLSEEERAHFEKHYFECTECADAVAAGQVFVNHIGPPRLKTWYWAFYA